MERLDLLGVIALVSTLAVSAHQGINETDGGFNTSEYTK